MPTRPAAILTATVAPAAAHATAPAPDAHRQGERLLGMPEVLHKTGRGRTQTLDDVKAGTFPAPIHVGRRSLWLESEIDDWIGERVAEARSKARA